MQDIIVVLGAAAIVATIFHLVNVPPIVAFFTAGALIGPHFLALVKEPPNVELMTEGAGLLLMFTIGLDFSVKELKAFGRPLFFIGVGQVVNSVVIFSAILFFLVGFPFSKAVFWSFIITLSSTAVVMKTLADHRDFESPHGKSAFAILLSQDLAVIPMLMTIPFLMSSMSSDLSLSTSGSLVDSLLPLALLLIIGSAILYFISQFGLPAVLNKVAQTKNREVFFFFIVFFVATVSIAVHNVGLSYSMGAFIAGMLIAGSTYGRQATADFKPLRDAFLGLFFVTIGMLLDLRFLFENFHKVASIGLIVLGIKAAIIFTMVWITGNSGTTARIVAIFIFQMGEFSFVLADQGMKLGLIEKNEMQYFLAVAIISLAFTPFVYKLIPFLSQAERYRRLLPTWFYAPAVNLRKKMLGFVHASLEKHTDKNHDHHHNSVDILVIGFGVAGRSLAKVLRANKLSYKIIESNGETVRQFADSEPILFGDASSLDILESSGIMSAKLCVILTSGISTLDPVIHSVRRLRADIPIIARTNYLLDIDRVKGTRANLVVSELETTLETIVRVLHHLDVAPNKVEEFTDDLRQEFQKLDLSVSLR